LFWLFKKKLNKNRIQEFDYVHLLISRLNGSKYCQVNANEETFIKAFLERLNEEELNGYIRLERLSNKSISVYYKTYPICKLKLNGKKTWMQILLSLYETKVLENEPVSRYIDGIDEWLSYIKKQKL
jgi:hypothetical protein